MKTPVTIVTYDYSDVAYILKEQLEKKNIKSCVIVEPGGLDKINAKKQYKVQVDCERVEEAIGVMLDMNADYSKKNAPPRTKKIIVAVDFSLYSLKACQYAIGLAADFDAEINLLHVYEDPFLDFVSMRQTATYQKFTQRLLSEAEENAKKELMKFNELFMRQLKESDNKKIKYHFTLIRGKAEQEILKASESYQPSLIIIGSRGKGDKANDLIGSVTAHIIEEVKYPLLCIPETALYAGKNQLNVLYATDFDEADFRSFRKLLSILGGFKVKIYAIHFDKDDKSPWNRMKLKELRQHLKQEYGEVDVSTELIEEKDKLQGIQNYIDNHQIDLISLTTHRRNIISKLFNPDIARKMVFHGSTPFLVFHSE